MSGGEGAAGSPSLPPPQMPPTTVCPPLGVFLLPVLLLQVSLCLWMVLALNPPPQLPCQ